MTALTTTSALVQPEYILGAAEINRAVAQITEKGQQLDDFIQYTALSVLNHVDLHGDITVANALFLGMPRGSRRAALADFLLKFGKLSANTDRAASKASPFVYDKTKATDLAGARAKPWYDHKKEPDVIDMIDTRAAIAMLVKRLERDLSKGAKADDDNANLLTELKMLSMRPAAPVEVPVAANIH